MQHWNHFLVPNMFRWRNFRNWQIKTKTTLCYKAKLRPRGVRFLCPEIVNSLSLISLNIKLIKLMLKNWNLKLVLMLNYLMIIKSKKLQKKTPNLTKLLLIVIVSTSSTPTRFLEWARASFHSIIPLTTALFKKLSGTLILVVEQTKSSISICHTLGNLKILKKSTKSLMPQKRFRRREEVEESSRLNLFS